jgi:hypothetical protein
VEAPSELVLLETAFIHAKLVIQMVVAPHANTHIIQILLIMVHVLLAQLLIVNNVRQTLHTSAKLVMLVMQQILQILHAPGNVQVLSVLNVLL